jgi:hypothetical protein
MTTNPQDVLDRLKVCRSCSSCRGNTCIEANRPVINRARANDCSKFLEPISIAVIVTDHNYDEYLLGCLASIRDQTRKPDHVVVVHDRCDPENLARSTAIVRSFGFRSIVTDFGDVQLARSFGMQETRSDAVLFVDADNRPSVDFLRRSETQLKAAGPQVAAVYPAIHRRDVHGQLLETISEPYDRDRVGRVNCMDACSLVWRHALESSWIVRGVGHQVFEDWHMWNQLAAAGWSFEHCAAAVLHYRVHDQSMSAREHARVWTETRRPSVTLFIPLSGRKSTIEVYKAASLSLRLAQRQCPFEASVIICNTSPDRNFRSLCERSLPHIASFWDVRVYHQDLRLPGNLADLDRREVEYQVQLAICRIYNRFFAELQTDLAWIVEDDVLVPPNALEELLLQLDAETAAVSGLYADRRANDGSPLRPGAPAENVVAWRTGEDRYAVELLRPSDVPNGPVIEVAGFGYGCLLIRREAARLAPLAVTAQEQWVDPRMFRIIREAGWRLKLATGVRCQHLCSGREPVEV